MELILAAAAGIAGLVTAFQSKAVPSETDFKKAQEKLINSPDDADANGTVGKYLAFAQGNFDDAMRFLAKSPDKTLRTLAEHELDPSYVDTAPKQVGIADEWVAGSKSSPSLWRAFYQRGASWYTKAWAQMKGEPIWEGKLRERAQKMAMSRPLGTSKKGLPGGWKTDGGATLDGMVSRTGSYSVKVVADPKQELNLKSDMMPIPPGATIDYAGWVRSDGTDSKTDAIFLNWFDPDGRFLGATGVNAPTDLPFWNYLSGQAKAPDGATIVMTGLNIRSKKGTFWADDLSLKINGKDALKNPSFEDR